MWMASSSCCTTDVACCWHITRRTLVIYKYINNITLFFAIIEIPFIEQYQEHDNVILECAYG